MRVKRILPFLMCVLVATAGCSLFDGGGDDGPQGPPPEIPGRLVFSAPDEQGNNQIFSSFTNGNDLKQLTDLGADEAFSPAWSPDGQQIVFTTNFRATASSLSLFLMNADGSNMRPMKEREGSDIVLPGGNPRWSPDGGKIAFDSCLNCEAGGNNFEIFVYDVASSEITQLTDHPGRDFFPKWITNNKLFFISNRDFVGIDSLRKNEEIYQVSLSDNSISRISFSGDIGSFTLRSSENDILVRPTFDEQWFFIDLSTHDTTAFNVPAEVPKKFTAPIKWSADGSILLLRFGGFDGGAMFRFYDFNKEKLIDVNEEPMEVSIMDWKFN